MKRRLFGVTFCLALVGCNGGTDVSPPAQEANAPASQPAPVSEKPVVLKRDMVDVLLELAGGPSLNVATGKVDVPVRITNRGQVALSSAMQPPVTIGVQILGSGGTNKDPDAVRDFVRAPLPSVEPGKSVEVTLSLPLQQRMRGHQLSVELVQEKVAWFSSFGQAPLKIGPFERCGDALCG